MNRNTLLTIGFAAVAAIFTSASAGAQGRGNGHGRGNDHGNYEHRGGDRGHDHRDNRNDGYGNNNRGGGYEKHDHYDRNDRYANRGRGYDKRDYGYRGRGNGYAYGHGGRSCGAGYIAAPPRWASRCGYQGYSHVYFPDYHTFYDPYRGGYVYWNNNWCFSRTVPGFMARIDLGSARRQMMDDVPLDARPESYYDNCARSYPARRLSVEIPIPVPRIVIR